MKLASDVLQLPHLSGIGATIVGMSGFLQTSLSRNNEAPLWGSVVFGSHPTVVGERENKPLTAIRGFAALWVVVGVHLEEGWAFPVGPHAHAMLLMGHVAVDVFFVLSGFILTLVYPDLVAAGAFALRRFCRVYPLHLCIMTALGLAGLYTQITRGESHPWHSFWPALLLVQPYIGMLTDWNVASWSVGVELICYAFFPLFNAAMRTIRRPGVIGGVLAFTIIEIVVLKYFDDVAAGPGAVLRALGGFFLGCSLARLLLFGNSTFAKHAALLQVVAVAALAVSVATTNDTAAVLAAAVLIAAIALPTGAVVRLLSVRPLVWLGQVSFSIYLLNIPLMSVFEKLPPIRSALAHPSSRFVVAACFLPVLLLISGITYRLIERPFRRLPDLLLRRSPLPAPDPSPASDPGMAFKL